MGKMKGAAVVLTLICDDPICQVQGVVDINDQRDALIVAAAMAGIPAPQIAFANNMSRQRVYQVVDSWKRGI